ncbi:MAG: hypothetical protein D6693_09860 [Planctomycetota bacterium]|nr:MAG: hypothetical protein D6693_09860 [Planctomycetota bacterium]
MLSSQRALFGGALLAAGLTGQAHGQFLYQNQDATGTFQSYAYSYAFGGLRDTAYRPSALNTYSYSPGAAGYSASTFTTFQDGRTMGTTATLSPNATSVGYGTSRVQQFFRVAQNQQLTIEWDIRGTDQFVSGFVLETLSGVQLFTLNPAGAGSDPPQGVVTVNLFAGVDYTAFFGFRDQASGFGPFLTAPGFTNFIQMSVTPTPGAAGLLGMAGLVAFRRRRST